MATETRGADDLERPCVTRIVVIVVIVIVVIVVIVIVVIVIVGIVIVLIVIVLIAIVVIVIIFTSMLVLCLFSPDSAVSPPRTTSNVELSFSKGHTCKSQ